MGSGDAHFLRTRHWMTADKVCAGSGDWLFELPHEAGFNAANVRYDSSAAQCWKHLPHQRLHLGDWCAQHHQVSAFHR